MTNPSTHWAWGILVLIVPCGVVGLALNLTHGSGSPAVFWVWAAASIIASACAIGLSYLLKVFGRAAR